MGDLFVSRPRARVLARRCGVNKRDFMNRLILIVGSLLVGGCITTPSSVVSVGKDTYQLSATGVGFSTQSAANMAALEAASGYCANLGRKMLLKQSAENGVYGFSPRRSDLTFMCLKEDDPAYQQPVEKKTQ